MVRQTDYSAGWYSWTLYNRKTKKHLHEAGV